jgi:hypothetical protein
MLRWREDMAGAQPGETSDYFFAHVTRGFCVGGTEPVCVLVYREKSRAVDISVTACSGRALYRSQVKGPTPANLANKNTVHHRQCWQIQ